MTSTFDPSAAASADSGIFGLPTSLEQARVVLVPVPFDATTSYGAGTAQGPAAILKASRQIDLFDVQVGRPYAAGICMLPIDPALLALNRRARELAEPIIARGGMVQGDEDLLLALAEVNEAGETLHAWVYHTCRALLEAGKLVGVVGGDHSTPFGAIRAVSERHPGLGILHIDAHADLRQAYEGFTHSHASIMYNVMQELPQVARLVQVGIRDFCEEELEQILAPGGRIQTFFDAQLQARAFEGIPWNHTVREIIGTLPGQVYVSFDIDGLEANLCPHTGTPVPGGLTFMQAVALLLELVRSGRRIVGFDLNEVAPGEDGSEWDASVGARMLYKQIGVMLLSQGVGEAPDLVWRGVK